MELHAELLDLIERLRAEKRTLVSRSRLEGFAQLCLDRVGLGAFVECGVGKGGCVAVMAATADGRTEVWGFDAFEGMPALTEEDSGDGEEWVGVVCAGEEGSAAVAMTFGLAGQSLEAVHVVKGWFEDTLPTRRSEIGPIGVLRLDNDWYQSTRFCLEQLYDQVQNGGVVVIDDYGTFSGCRRAVDEFRAERGIGSPLVVVDEASEVYWQVVSPRR